MSKPSIDSFSVGDENSSCKTDDKGADIVCNNIWIVRAAAAFDALSLVGPVKIQPSALDIAIRPSPLFLNSGLTMLQY